VNLGPHAAFIVGAYAVAILIVAAMITWVCIDHRRQTRTLSELDARGLTRRSDRTSQGKDRT
jgi:heme exporter protein D